MARGRKKRIQTTINESDDAPIASLSSIPVSSTETQEGGGDGSNSAGLGDGGDSASANSDSDSDSGSGITTGEQYDFAGGDDGEDKQTPDGRIGVEGSRIPGGVRPSGDGVGGTRTRRTGGSQTRSNRRAGEAQERTAPDSAPTPREVPLGSLGGKKKANDSISEDFITEGVGLAMYGIGMSLNDVETWQVQEDDAREFAHRVHKWLNSGGAKKANALQKWIAKNEPLIGVGLGAVTLIGPRLVSTLQKRRKGVNLQTQAASSDPVRPDTATASASGDGGSIPIDRVRRAANGTQPDSARANARPFGRNDFRTVYGDND